MKRGVLRVNTKNVLLVPESFYRIKERCLVGRVETEEYAHQPRKAEGEDNREGRDDCGPAGKHRDQLRSGYAEDDPGHSSDQ